MAVTSGSASRFTAGTFRRGCRNRPSSSAAFPAHCRSPRGEPGRFISESIDLPLHHSIFFFASFRQRRGGEWRSLRALGRGRRGQVGTMAPPRSVPTRAARPIGVLTGAGDVAGTAARFRSQANTPRSPRAAPARVLRELSILCIAFFVLSIRCARDGGCFRSSRPARLSDHKIPACWASSATFRREATRSEDSSSRSHPPVSSSYLSGLATA